MSAAPGRTHRYLTATPLFPFGYGLASAAAATYSELTVTPRTVSAAAPPPNLTVAVQLTSQPLAAAGVAAAAEDQVEVVQVYISFGKCTHLGDTQDDVAAAAAVAELRERGASSVPLHSLVAFRRIALSSAMTTTASGGATAAVEFKVAVKSLELMKADGKMGLLEGPWCVFVGGTSPRTPTALLRRHGSNANPGAPEKPLIADLDVTE